MSKSILVTGAAGFIGFHVTEALIKKGYKVVGIDNINNYYDPALKFARLKESGIDGGAAAWHKQVASTKNHLYRFVRMNLEDKEQLSELCTKEKFNTIIHLAAQAGVRYSIENPDTYVQSNIVGFLNVLECCRHYGVKKLVYASSSSVYGNSIDTPFSTDQRVDNPISLYAATKKSNELMAHTYSHLYGFQTVGLRFFTVYGPWGRPDMAMFLFTDSILNNKPIKVFNSGQLSRDFTYIDDIVEGIRLVAEDEKNGKGYQLFNIGNSKPVQLLEFITEIERVTGKTAVKEMMPMQPGDVNQTWADVEGLRSMYEYNPSTSVGNGIEHFINWYKIYYNIGQNA